MTRAPRLLAIAIVASAVAALACTPINRNKKRAKTGGDGTAGALASVPRTAPAAGKGKYTLLPTTAATDLQQITTDPIDEEHPSLSPDSSTLLVGLRQYDRDAKVTLYPGVITIPANGGTRTFLTAPGTEALRPTWLPDGSTFVYASSATGDLALVRANTKQPGAAFTVVAPAHIAASADYPTVAPDGLVALTVEVQKQRMIATVRLDGTNYQLVEQGTHAAFSPDGKRLAFVRAVGSHLQLFVSDRSGGAVAQLTYGSSYAMWPAWSPDGQFITFASNKGNETASEDQQISHLFVIRATGGGVTQVTSGTADCGFPHWGRDGNIYFNSDQAGNYDIWRVRPVVAAVGSAI